MSDPLVDFYTHRYDEAGRLGRANNRLERERTRELLRARLPPPPARVLDVGGGTGAHAEWLAAAGYDIELVDIVPAHVEAARAGGLAARLGDARALDAPDGAVDACLLLGPLYHLPDAPDRAAAVAEAARVTRPGGLVAAAAICRFAFPLYALRDGDLPEAALPAIAATLAGGAGDPIGELPVVYSHRPADLAAELSGAGLTGVEVLGIEGPGWILFAPGVEATGELLDRALRAARLYDAHPEMAAVSAHLLACGRTPPA